MTTGFVTAGFMTGKVASAQQAYTGSVLGIEYIDGDRCNITLSNEDGQTVTEVTDALTCDSVVAGNRIVITQGLVRVNVLPSPETATVTRVEQGDRTCYIGLTDADNNTFVQLADFSICQQNLEGARVQLTYGSSDILAYSCQGDADCGISEPATIITQAEVIDRPTTTAPPAAAQPTAQPMIGSLPDGNYRYWNGEPTDGIVSDDDLLASGERTLVVRFRKQGNNFTGIFGYVNDEAICVQGQINEDTVTGISVQKFPEITPISTGETFSNFGATERLKVRRGRQLPSSEALVIEGRRVPINVVRYDSTILDLSGLNRINAGTQVPPRRC